MKIRGKKEDIVNFLKNELKGSSVPVITKNEDGTPNLEYKQRDIVFEETEYGGIKLKCLGGFYLNDTRRAFIEHESLDFGFYSEDNETIQIEGFKQAWGVWADNYAEMSEKYDLDIKIFAFERGMEFTQEIEIIKGEIIKDESKEYEDYQWEVPFSHLGG